MNDSFYPDILLAKINKLITQTNWDSVKNPDMVVLAIETKAYLIYASRKVQRIIEVMENKNV